jgi:phosphopantetheine adenylyltransferase
VAGFVLLVLFPVGSPGADAIQDALREQVRENDRSRASQDRIDELSDDIDAMAAEYRAALQDTRALEVYNRQLEALVASQDTERESLERQMANVTNVGRQVMPLMERMLDTLDAFVEVDLPSLPEERRERIRNLREMMQRADVTIAEKYRRVLEAYQIENEYGRTIEAYRGSLEGEGGTRTVDFLRIGRNALLYQTLDGSESGVWDTESGSWKKLSDSYRSSIREGLRIARKQVAPDLLVVPLPPPEAVQ